MAASVTTLPVKALCFLQFANIVLHGAFRNTQRFGNALCGDIVIGRNHLKNFLTTLLRRKLRRFFRRILRRILRGTCCRVVLESGFLSSPVGDSGMREFGLKVDIAYMFYLFLRR